MFIKDLESYIQNEGKTAAAALAEEIEKDDSHIYKLFSINRWQNNIENFFQSGAFGVQINPANSFPFAKQFGYFA